MEFEHFSHQHPLILSEHKDGNQFICSGCEDQISGPSYHCAACKFFLHKKCAELPWEIKSHLHSKHSLVLLAQPPPYYIRCVCDFCRKTCKSFVYHCSYCKFDLDIQCAFPQQIFDGNLWYREKELKHFSHPHPLILSNINEKSVCYACQEDIIGPRYSCEGCNFILHMRCGELPSEMMCHLHPQHPLVLLARPPYYQGQCVCNLCRRNYESFIYHCKLCHFDADVKCAFPWIFEGNSNRRAVEFKHFSHPHPLIFNNEQKADDEIICSGCEERVSGPTYDCSSCNFILHKKCAELPQEIRSNFHQEHPLVLLAKPAPHYRGGGYVCDFCNKSQRSFSYHCSVCSFDLDVKCAFPPCIFEADKQKHQFIRLLKSVPLKSFSFTCSACGTDGSTDVNNCPCLCTKCQLILHRKCTSLAQTISIELHQHPISLTYFPRKIEDGSTINCRVCQNELKAYFGGYCCRECNFSAHVKCILDTLRSRVHDGMTRVACNADPSQAITSRMSETRLEDDKGISEIKHFTHQHSLMLLNDANNNKVCNGCMLPIFSGPHYGCKDCDFYLDKVCTELPNQKLFLNGGLPLTLRPKAPTIDGLFRCSACHQYSNGFIYKSDEIDVNFDVRCSNLISNIFKHEGHEHPLCFAPKSGRHCDACGENGWPFLFTCPDCNFNLDFRCASLPNKVRHRYDRHPLLLAYNLAVEGSEGSHCDICQCERDPKLWFYNCAECSFAAHPNCILGKNHLVKLGGAYAYDIHPHPLVLVQKKGKFPSCHSCCRPCDDLALECSVSECNFIIHRKKAYCLSKIYKDE